MTTKKEKEILEKAHKIESRIMKDIEEKCNPITKEDYKFIDFYCRAHLIPKGKGYESILIRFLNEYKLNEKQIKKNNKQN